MIGLVIAISVISVWLSHLLYCLNFVQLTENIFVSILHSLIQAYLFTGLFITAHDAMHGTVSRNRTINKVIGTIACFLFAGLSYKRLIHSHALHHKHPTDSEKDPDFHHSNNYFLWFFSFMVRYTTISQIVIMAITFNVLKIWFLESSILYFWVIPSLLGTIQLFTFGTYFPHKKPHTTAMQPHFARSLRKNHVVAMITCYFFGYHSEHHQYPHIPWWKLYSVKTNQTDSK
jgi:beta-carotene ketolase (CrtW type)